MSLIQKNRERVKTTRRTIKCDHCGKEFDFEEFTQTETWRVYETRIDFCIAPG